MRAVLQRVKEARVEVGGEAVGEIGRGVLALLAVGEGDGERDVAWMKRKIVNLRIFPDRRGKMNLALGDVGGQVLVVPQFTLYGDCRKGNRPSYSRSAPPGEAERLYRQLLDGLRADGVPAASGRFQAAMEIFLVNDGPVTLLLDSRERI